MTRAAAVVLSILSVLAASSCKASSSPAPPPGEPIAAQEAASPQGEPDPAPQAAAEPQSEPVVPEEEEWHPPAPDGTEDDWILMTSGEWLRGEITVLRSETLEFDSEEFDDLNLDWGDVAELRSAKQNTVVLTERRTVLGTVQVRGDQIVVLTDEGEKSFPRSEVLSIVPGEPSEKNYWSGKITFGLTAQSGNTNQTTINSKLNVLRRTPFTRLELNYVSNFGELEGDTNVDNQRFVGKWDIFVSQRWFVTPISYQAFRDPFTNIAIQHTPSVGGGYHAVDTSKLALDLILAAGVRHTEFDSTAAGQDSSETTSTVIPGLKMDWDITEKIEFDLSYRLDIGVPETSNTNQFLLTSFSVDVWGDLDFDLTFQWDHIGEPASDVDGDTPLQDDFRTTIGLKWNW